jgi:hypothetical protein
MIFALLYIVISYEIMDTEEIKLKIKMNAFQNICVKEVLLFIKLEFLCCPDALQKILQTNILAIITGIIFFISHRRVVLRFGSFGGQPFLSGKFKVPGMAKFKQNLSPTSAH